MEAKLQAATGSMHGVWQRLKIDTINRDTQLRTAVWHACN